MTEEVLQLVWQHRLYHYPLTTNNGEMIEVVNPGVRNIDAGPDFANATIKVNGVSFVGTVEIHSRASDWYIHGHQKDDRYNNVILHVVEEDDREVPQAMFQSAFMMDEKAIVVAHELAVFPSGIRCFRYWAENRERLSEVLQNFVPELLEERLMSRAKEILRQKSDWQSGIDEVLYFRLIRTLGGNTNQEAFERVARTVTLKRLNDGFYRITDIEAMLFGAAGFIPSEPKDAYTKLLKLKFEGYNSDGSLPPMDIQRWKLGRFRPIASPAVRIAQAASFLEKNKKYLSAKLLSGQSVKEIVEMFSCEVSEYWKTHYSLDGKEGKSSPKTMGADCRKSMIINAIALVIYALGVENGSEAEKEKARLLLRCIPFENNHITEDWKELVVPSFKLKGADTSQALIYLRKAYCDKKECLRCPVCHYLLRY